MSSQLKDVTEHTMHALSDLVGEARDLFDELPIPGTSKRSPSRSRVPLLGIVIAVVVVIAVVYRAKAKRVAAPEANPSGRGASPS